MNKWMRDARCVFARCVYVGCERVSEFINPFDSGLWRCAAPSEASEVIKRAVSHYLLAKQSGGGGADVIQAECIAADFKCNF